MILPFLTDVRFILLVGVGALAGLFVGAIPGLSVSMATAILVSVTYSWQTTDALATIMGVYVVGVFSGAVSAILINIPGAPSSVVTTLDGFPLAQQGKADLALKYAAVYSFVGSVFGIVALWLFSKPVSTIALKFQPMDYFLLAFLGLTTVGTISGKNFSKGIISALIGLFISCIGIDSVVGTPRFTFGIMNLQAGVSIVPALIGLFGFAEVLNVISKGDLSSHTSFLSKSNKKDNILKHFPMSLYYSAIGTLVGALPGAGGPVASFLAYSEAKRIEKNPSVPFGQGAVEGIVASESANNACIGGALIPMLTLAIPGDSVTAIILSVFYLHGLRPGPMFIRTNPQMFGAIVAGGLIGCVFLLLLGLFVAPKISKILFVPKNILMPIIAVLCCVGAFAGNNRMFDVYVMVFFGVMGHMLIKGNYPIAPLTLGLVLGKMMDDNFRRAISLASSEDSFIKALLFRPITITLMVAIALIILINLGVFKKRGKVNG